MTKATISFVTQETDSKIKIAADEERNIDSLGNVKTSFLFGDTAYFRIYADNLDNVFVTSTDGTVSAKGTYTEDVADEIITFVTENSAEPEKPVISLTTYSWLGKTLGTITRDGLFSLSCSTEPSPTEGLIASASVNYRSAYKLFGLTLNKRDRLTYPVTIYAGVKNG